MMVNPVTTAVVYAIVGSVVVQGVLRFMGTRDNVLVDVVGACVAGALASLVPTIGGPLSLLVTLGALYWRGVGHIRDIALAVAVARLAMVPALLALGLARH